MKLTVTLILFLLSLASAQSQTAPPTTLTAIDGDTIQLSQYQGKKLMVVLLPVSHSEADSLMLLNIDSVYRQYGDSIAFIGVPSYEDGYADSLQADSKTWYRDVLHLGFAITTGMYTHNASGSQQHPLFQWLTTEQLNGHFGTDVNTHGQKFMLDANGQLTGVFNETTRLSNGLMEALLQ